MSPRPQKFDLQTQIVHGDDDQIVPIGAAALRSAKLVRNAKLKVYPGAPHGLADTHKEQLNLDLPRRAGQFFLSSAGILPAVSRSGKCFPHMWSAAAPQCVAVHTMRGNLAWRWPILSVVSRDFACGRRSGEPLPPHVVGSSHRNAWPYTLCVADEP